MATKNKTPAKKAPAAKGSGSTILPLGPRKGNPGDKMDWKKRRDAMNKAIDGKK